MTSYLDNVKKVTLVFVVVSEFGGEGKMKRNNIVKLIFMIVVNTLAIKPSLHKNRKSPRPLCLTLDDTRNAECLTS